MVPLMSIWRNFFLGAEPTTGVGPLRCSTSPARRGSCARELRGMGIDIRDPDQPVGTLSGGERQSVAIARAIYFGARVLILDEPTSALGVKQAGVVLRYILQARERGVGVIFITHNPHHAHPVGDRFVILNRGRTLGSYAAARSTRPSSCGSWPAAASWPSSSTSWRTSRPRSAARAPARRTRRRSGRGARSARGRASCRCGRRRTRPRRARA